MPAAGKRVTVKRVYEKPARGDGYRVLVDRLWPRGLSKSQAALRCLVARSCSLGRTAPTGFTPVPKAGWLSANAISRNWQRPQAAEALDELYRLARRKKNLTLAVRLQK